VRQIKNPATVNPKNVTIVKAII